MSDCGRLDFMDNKVVTDHRVTLECRVDVDIALQAYLRAHGIVGLLELVRDVTSMQADPNGDYTGRRHYKACSLLDELLDTV